MILDTSAYSNLGRGNKHIADLINKYDNLYIPVIVHAELLQGFKQGNKSEQNTNDLHRFMSQPFVSTLDIDLETSKIYSYLYVHIKNQGKVLSHNDIWIAALAVQHDLPLVTFDNDFECLRSEIPELFVLLF